MSLTDRSLGASWSFGDAKLSLAQRRWRHGDDRQVNTLLGLTIAAGAGQVRLSWVHADQGGASFAIPGGPAVSASPTAANHFGGRSSTAWEIGLRHDF